MGEIQGLISAKKPEKYLISQRKTVAQNPSVIPELKKDED